MAEDKKDEKSPRDDNLEAKDTVVESGSGGSTTDGASLDNDNAAATPPPEDVKPKKSFIKKLLGHVNIYIVLFLVLLGIAGAIAASVYLTNKEENEKSKQPQKLTTENLNDLKGSTTTIGDPKQILNVESSAIFSGKVLVRDSLDVAGTIKVGGALSLPGITVSGTSAFDQVTINNLSISGNTSILGQLAVQKGLTVSGPANFGGPISAPALNIENLQISRDLILNRHIDPNGSTPGKSNGTALGNGGTVSVNGTDTAGTITINTGTSPAAGCFVTIIFNQRFNGTPHVVVTPVGSGAAGLNYYITRTTTNFSVCTTNSPPGPTTFFFDYIALD